MLRTTILVGALVGLGAVCLAVSPAVMAGNTENATWADTPIGKLISSHVGRFLVLRSELNLTDEQKTKIKETLKARKPEIAKVAKSVLEERASLRDAVLADPPNEKAIRKASEELGKAIGDAAELASRVVGEIRPVLTTEQREKIKAFRAASEEGTLQFLDRAVKAE